MTTDELAGRMLALEVMAMASLGLYLANSRNDPDMERGRAFLDWLRQMIADKSVELTAPQADAAKHYADELLSQVLENLRTLRGEG